MLRVAYASKNQKKKKTKQKSTIVFLFLFHFVLPFFHFAFLVHFLHVCVMRIRYAHMCWLIGSSVPNKRCRTHCKHLRLVLFLFLFLVYLLVQQHSCTFNFAPFQHNFNNHFWSKSKRYFQKCSNLFNKRIDECRRETESENGWCKWWKKVKKIYNSCCTYRTNEN